MHLLFVSGIDGFCHRYQVLHRAAQIEARGGVATVRHFRDPRLVEDASANELLFLYRVPWTPTIERLVLAARQRRVPVMGSIDDLIFVDDPDWLPDLDGLEEAERALWREGVRRYRATLELCDAFVAPTEPLAEAAASLGWRAHLHRNSLAPAELELARRARVASGGGDRAVTIGYFSGTASHDADLATAAAPLAETLRAFPQARLLVVGPVLLPAELDAFAERIERHDLVDWHELPALMARAHVHLAPLEIGRRFAAAKGEIKYLEAAALGVPVVASPSAAYRHAIDDGRNGRLAASEAEWRHALSALVGDAALRHRLGAAALADVTGRYAETARGAELAALVLEACRGTEARPVGERPRAARPFDAEPSAGAAQHERTARVALEADACPALPARAVTDVSPPLGGGSRLVQRFRAACDGLLRVDVHTVTYGQALAHRLLVALRDEEGALLAAAEMTVAEIPDRSWVALETDPLPDSHGRVYAIEITAPGAGPGEAISFGLTRVPAACTPGAGEAGAAGARGARLAGALGAAALDGTPLGGRLALRAFARWDLALGGAADTAAVHGEEEPRADGGPGRRGDACREAGARRAHGEVAKARRKASHA